jgi:hypothetical protein
LEGFHLLARYVQGFPVASILKRHPHELVMLGVASEFAWARAAQGEAQEVVRLLA